MTGEWIAMLHGGTAGVAARSCATLVVLGYALWKSPRIRWSISASLAVVVGISLNYLWLPIRAAQFPPINEGEPVGFLSQALQDVLNRVQYGKPPLSERQATFTGQLGNFWQYFSWQFARDWGRLRRRRHRAVHRAGTQRALGAVEAATAGPASPALALLGTLSVGLVYYMNFKYGFSQYPGEPSLPREVRERDYFFIGSFAVFGAFVALGLGALMQGIVEFLSDRGHPASRWAAASPVLALALIPLFGNRITASRAHETTAPRFCPRHSASRSSPTAS